MENKFLDNFSRSFSVELPKFDTMSQYLDFIIPQIRPLSEDLYEKQYYLDTRWLEIRDSDDFHEAVLHIFRDKSEYLISIDGNISKGNWRLLGKSNTMILERGGGGGGKNELYDLAYLDRNFFILRKHGNQRSHQKYFVLGREPVVRGLEWRDVMELLFNLFRQNPNFTYTLVAIIVIVAIVILLSII